MKYAITGSTGGFGSAAISILQKWGIPASSIRAIARNAEKSAPLKEQGIDVKIADYEDLPSLEQAFQGISKVLLVSGSEVGKRFNQHKNVIDAAKSAGVGQILYTSITKADSSTNILAPEHKQTEEYLKSAGIDYVILRDNWYTENYIGDVQYAGQTGIIATATGKGRVASAAREEYAEAAAAVLTGQGHSRKIYELAGEVWDFKDLAQAASQVFGKEITHKLISSEERKTALEAAGMDEGTAGFYAALDQSIAEGSLDIESKDLEKLLGRKPASLVETLKKILA